MWCGGGGVPIVRAFGSAPTKMRTMLMRSLLAAELARSAPAPLRASRSDAVGRAAVEGAARGAAGVRRHQSGRQLQRPRLQLQPRRALRQPAAARV